MRLRDWHAAAPCRCGLTLCRRARFLLTAGGGHVGLAAAPLVCSVGFEVILVEA